MARIGGFGDANSMGFMLIRLGDSFASARGFASASGGRSFFDGAIGSRKMWSFEEDSRRVSARESERFFGSGVWIGMAVGSPLQTVHHTDIICDPPTYTIVHRRATAWA